MIQSRNGKSARRRELEDEPLFLPRRRRNFLRRRRGRRRARSRAPSSSHPRPIPARTRSQLSRQENFLRGPKHAHFEAGGAYTGELSLPQAKDAKASYVLIGHAERRAMGETNDDTQKKVAAALALKLTPILCVGRRRGSTTANITTSSANNCVPASRVSYRKGQSRHHHLRAALDHRREDRHESASDA